MDHLTKSYANQEARFNLENSYRMTNSGQPSPTTILDAQIKQQSNMCQQEKQQRNRVSSPLLFSIDYILNLAVKEQQQAYPHNYLAHLAQLQQYQQQQQEQLLRHQHQHHQHHLNHQRQQKDDLDQSQDCRKKKTRTVFTKPQVMHLESVFRLRKYLTCFERSQLATSMNLSETQIKIWFQNRRNKFKREHQTSHLV